MSANDTVDLVGGPFAVLESDPGAFTILLRKLGMRGLEVTEVYDIAPWATDHLDIRGLIFCYPCEEHEQDTDGAGVDFPDPDAEEVWFANQLSTDACASQAILNVALNLDGVDMRPELLAFYRDTERMSSVMKGLAISNCAFIRDAHNSLARPADIRGAQHGLAASTLEYTKSAKAASRAHGPPAKRRKAAASPRKAKPQAAGGELQDAFHYIGYVPARGAVWELDGLRAVGPLAVGALPDAGGAARWMDVVRPALRRRMQRVQARASDRLRYSLLAVVDDRYEKASDALEMLKRERVQLERRLDAAYPAGWNDKVDPLLAASAATAFETSVQPESFGRTFSQGFASRKLEQDMKILDMPERALLPAWEACVKAAAPIKAAVEDELANSRRAHTDHISRTTDYEPFLETFITCMQNEGLLDPILSQ